MHEVVFISYCLDDSTHAEKLIIALRGMAFNVWHLGAASESYGWRAERQSAIQNSNAVIVLLSPSAKVAKSVLTEAQFAVERSIGVVPVLVDGDSTASVPQLFETVPMIDISSVNQFEAGLHQLFQRIRTIFSDSPKTKYQHVQDEIYKVTSQIPDVRTYRIVSVDGVIHTFNYVNSGSPYEVREEDRLAPMSAATLSLSERIVGELGLREFKFTVMAGLRGMYFNVPIGDGAEWCFGLVVKGHPSIDHIIKCFEESNYLEAILPLL